MGFLFSLYRVSRKERKWWRDSTAAYEHRGDGYDEEAGRMTSPYALRYHRQKLLTTPRDGRGVQSAADATYSGSLGRRSRGDDPVGLPRSSSLFMDDEHD